MVLNAELFEAFRRLLVSACTLLRERLPNDFFGCSMIAEVKLVFHFLVDILTFWISVSKRDIPVIPEAKYTSP